jgi:hypothetical protein
MTIIKKIQQCAADYELATSVKPKRIYLGRGEMRVLRKWAYDLGYKTEPTTAAVEGAARTEVFGLTIYEVDDEQPHMTCCA